MEKKKRRGALTSLEGYSMPFVDNKLKAHTLRLAEFRAKNRVSNLKPRERLEEKHTQIATVSNGRRTAVKLNRKYRKERLKCENELKVLLRKTEFSKIPRRRRRRRTGK